MSEVRIYELHKELARKLIEEAKATKNKTEIRVLVKLSGEIISIRREITKEIHKMSGYSEQNKIMISQELSSN
jgi:hypothetical protein